MEQKIVKRKRTTSDISDSSEDSEDLDDLFGDSSEDAFIEMLRDRAPLQMANLSRQNAQISMNTNNLTLFL